MTEARRGYRIWLLALFAVFLALTTGAQAHGMSDAEVRELRRAIEVFDDEPDVYEVQQRVLEHRDFDDQRPDRWTRRSRLSHLLPRVQGQTNWLDQHHRQDRFREDIDADEEGAYQRDGAQHLWRDDLRFRSIYSLRVDFDLSGLLYSGDEMAIQREVRSRWAMHDELIEEVTHLYFARRRLQLHGELFTDDDTTAALERHLEIEALTARIDALTGGWFRTRIQEVSR